MLKGLSRRAGELDVRNGREKPRAAEVVRRMGRWRREKGVGRRAALVVVEEAGKRGGVVWRVRRRREGRRSMVEDGGGREDQRTKGEVVDWCCRHSRKSIVPTDRNN